MLKNVIYHQRKKARIEVPEIPEGKRKAPQEEISRRVEKKAYELYEQKGRVPGQDMDNWLEAEKLVKNEMRPCSTEGKACCSLDSFREVL